MLPSLISRIAHPNSKGAALGVYNTTQAFGLFLGGALGGWLVKNYDAGAAFVGGGRFDRRSGVRARFILRKMRSIRLVHTMCGPNLALRADTCLRQRPRGGFGTDRLLALDGRGIDFGRLLGERRLAQGGITMWLAGGGVKGGMAYGATDEWHQSFVPGRSTELADWIADTAGAAGAPLPLPLVPGFGRATSCSRRPSAPRITSRPESRASGAP